jgi:hypothetical protein
MKAISSLLMASGAREMCVSYCIPGQAPWSGWFYDYLRVVIIARKETAMAAGVKQKLSPEMSARRCQYGQHLHFFKEVLLRTSKLIHMSWLSGSR